MMMMSSPSDKTKRKRSKDSLALLPCFYFVELPIAASSAVSLYFLELTDVLRPPRLSFRCHDRHLSKPYVDGGQEMIPLLMLLSLAFAGPAASIMLVEAFVYLLQSRTEARRAEGGVDAGGCNFNSFLRRTVRFVGMHVLGLCATALVTDVIQLSTGYHAPFFLTVCKPNYSRVSCDANAYVTKDICSGHDRQAIAAARKTFPSRHATLSAFAAVYVSMYFNSAVSDGAKLLKPVLVFAFAVAAALSGLTQITQHRSHPVDVYVGFAIGAFIAAYLAFHAAANFESPDVPPAAPSPPSPGEDPLRALTERGHESVYDKGPASASESNDEIAAAAAGPLRSQGPTGSPTRAGVDVELTAPRGPTAKETMLTFGNALPPTGGGGGDGAPAPVRPRLKAVHVPSDPVSSRRSMETRVQGVRNQSARGAGLDDGASPALVRRPAASDRNPTPTPPAGAAAAPRPPQIPEAGPPPVSPKTSLARAKWSAIRERTAAEASGRLAAGQPRPIRAAAASERRGLPASPPSVEKSPESAGAGSGSSSAARRWPSPRRGPATDERRDAVVAVDARASHRPLAPSPPSPWEWSGPGPQPGDSAARGGGGGGGFRPQRAAAGASPPTPPMRPPPRTQFEGLTDAQRKEMASRRKTALVLLERDAHLTNEENRLRSFRGRGMKE